MYINRRCKNCGVSIVIDTFRKTHTCYNCKGIMEVTITTNKGPKLWLIPNQKLNVGSKNGKRR